MIMDAKKILKENGQALMEFVIFLPFMMMMYMTILAMGNAINGSINQQKVTRAYFYYRAAHNSTMPRPRRDGIEPADGWNSFGMQIMGWSEKLAGSNGNTPFAPCYRFELPFEGVAGGTSCDETYTEPATQLVRVRTVYGICGATYIKNTSTQENVRQPANSSPFTVTSNIACLIED